MLVLSCIDLLPLSGEEKQVLAERLRIIIKETDEWISSLFDPNDWSIWIYIPKRRPWSEDDRETCLGLLAHEIWHAYEEFVGKATDARVREALGWQCVYLLSPDEFKALCFETRFWDYARYTLQRLAAWAYEKGEYSLFLKRLREASADGAFF